MKEELLKLAPFYLSDDDVRWVMDTYEQMTIEERIGQLFCPIVFTKDEKELKEFLETFPVGGILYREGDGEEIRKAHKVLQENSKIPLLLASNLEYGGVGSALEGTYYGRQMLVAATGNAKHAYQLGKVSGKEGAAVGVNLSLAPVTDIDMNFRNPITNVRTYGSNVETIKEMALSYMRGATEEGVAVSVKHFPGDGVDERDQHLLTSVNSLEFEQWDQSYGEIYRTMIEAGALTFMAGHIAFPAAEEKYDGVRPKQMLPATLSKNIATRLLREHLGFNGLLCTDATPMVGFCCAMDRKTAVPTAIENGCDFFLFNKDELEDYGYMLEGYKNGILSEQRLKEANMRILAVKAALKLHEKQKSKCLVAGEEQLSCLRCEQHDTWARECADEGVTLVKHVQQILPITPKKTPHILLEMLGDFDSNERVKTRFVTQLENAGFQVTVYEPEVLDFSKGKLFDTVEEFKEKYDLVLYVGNIETASNKTVARINWHTLFGLGNNMPWFVHEVPTIFVSVGNPYHLLDVPMVPVYINGYCNSDYVIDAIVEKLLGKSEWKGISPVDAFCGREDTRM